MLTPAARDHVRQLESVRVAQGGGEALEAEPRLQACGPHGDVLEAETRLQACGPDEDAGPDPASVPGAAEVSNGEADTDGAQQERLEERAVLPRAQTAAARQQSAASAKGSTGRKRAAGGASGKSGKSGKAQRTMTGFFARANGGKNDE